MERLTFDGNFCDIAQCSLSPCEFENGCFQKKVWERLKSYEDAGITPRAAEQARQIEDGLNRDGYSVARMVELMEADKEGRVVVLPCKVGDTVYFVNSKQILEFAVVGYAVDETGISWVYSEHIDKTGHTNERIFSPDRIRKTTFLTREEAEKALEARHGDR